MAAAHLLWFRRDLRLQDNPALLAAAEQADVLPLFVHDEHLWGPAGPSRRAWLTRSLAALDESLDGGLVVRRGDPVGTVVRAAREIEAAEVHLAADYGPYGRHRDEEVAAALAEHGIALVRTGSPYAVAPGRVTSGEGTPYKVFTPYYRSWLEHGWRNPAGSPGDVRWIRGVASDPLPDDPHPDGLVLPEVGEAAALRRWARFRDDLLAEYGEHRDRPDLPGTSSLSAHLKYGEIHPRTLLADLAAAPDGSSGGAEAYRRELAFREFYADVTWHRPQVPREYLRPEMARMGYDDGPAAEDHFAAWAAGETGFPMIDAGMRQLLAEGWIHNRVRMLVASFLVKDLHIDWRRGARHFLHWLRDGDISSNSHGWQWVAGSGTDAAPYFRVFNPVTQGLKFDPDGDYVRRYVPELREVSGRAVHEPWKLPGGPPPGYPDRIVDHAEERAEALRRYEQVRR